MSRSQACSIRFVAIAAGAIACACWQIAHKPIAPAVDPDFA